MIQTTQSPEIAKETSSACLIGIQFVYDGIKNLRTLGKVSLVIFGLAKTWSLWSTNGLHPTGLKSGQAQTEGPRGNRRLWSLDSDNAMRFRNI